MRRVRRIPPVCSQAGDGKVVATMSWSYKIFSVFGIGVRVHVTFFLIVGYFAFVWGVLRDPGGPMGALYGVLLVLLLFACVIVHELTHSRVAQAYGIHVRDITLLPIGGMASMDKMPDDPRQELIVSVSGPLSNVALAVVMAAASPLVVDTSLFTDPGRLSTAMLEPSVQGGYLYLLAINVMLAVFNLLPAFPMDGGRVFRAFLAMRVGRVRATRIAVTVGQTLAIGLGLLGIFGGGVLLIVVAVFIYFGAQAEGRGDVAKGALGRLRVSQAVNVEFERARPDQTIGILAARLFHSYQADFPVVDESGRLVGIVTRDRLITMLGQHGVDYPVREAMRTDFQVGGLDEPVYEVLQRMRMGGYRAMPIVDAGRLVGMLSLEDISEVFSLLSAAGPDFADRVPAMGCRGQGPGVPPPPSA
jgi:Zn-dependent protease/predicted transcriptional regulator